MPPRPKNTKLILKSLEKWGPSEPSALASRLNLNINTVRGVLSVLKSKGQVKARPALVGQGKVYEINPD